MLVAVCVQPWSTTTSGWFAGRFAGTYSYIASAPGFEPKLVTWVSAALAGDEAASTAARTRWRMAAAECTRCARRSAREPRGATRSVLAHANRLAPTV